MKHTIMKKQWKHQTAALFLLAVFFLLLWSPETASFGVSQGLLLWFQVLIPSLFPFFLLSGFLVRSGLILLTGNLLYPLLGRLFPVSPAGTVCILMGFLCGYPLGARTVADLYERGQLTRKEATFLFCFTNQVSPGFLSGFVITSCFHQPSLLLPALFCVYGIPLLAGRVFRKVLYLSMQSPCGTNQISVSQSHISTPNICFSFSVLDETIQSGLSSIALLGGYVVLFRILIQFLSASALPVHIKTALAGILEITSGVPCIITNAASVSLAFPAVMACLAFGGLSGLAQTRAVIGRTDLPFGCYILWKLFLALLAWSCASFYTACIL